VNGGEVGDEGEESLEDVELFVDTLRNAVVRSLFGWPDDRREEDSARLSTTPGTVRSHEASSIGNDL
jgi:hypothetical protein